jgi:prepilin-type N-terminal cleavage/methylation domain-containing protein
MHPHRLRNRNGHTLIELLTVLAVISLMVSLAAPSMKVYMERNRVRRALDRITNDISYARILAVRNGSRVVLRFSSATTYEVVQEGATPTTLRSVSLATDYPGVRITPPTADSQLEFDSRGMLRSTPSGAMIATSGATADSASITLAGGVYRAY